MKYVTKLKLLSFLPRALRRELMISGYYGRGEPELPHLESFVGRGDLALDVGCNLGIYAYALGRITGNVIAFEPNPVLSKFVRKLHLRGVRAVKSVALGAEPGLADLFTPPFRTGHQAATLARGGGGARPDELTQVKVERLDDQGLSDVRFIKIDVEGFEESVLSGASTIIERDRPTMLIEIEDRHNPGGLDRVINRLQPFGYCGQFLLDGVWTSVDLFQPDKHQRNDEEFWTQSRDLPRDRVVYINNFLFSVK